MLQRGMRDILDESLEGLTWKAALSTSFAGLVRGCEIANDESKGEFFSPEQHPIERDILRELTMSCLGALALRMRKRKDLLVLSGKHDTVYLAEGGRYVNAPAALRTWITVVRLGYLWVAR